MCKICVFAGTSEGRELIGRLMSRGARVTACVATEYGAEALASYEGLTVLTGRLDRGEMEELFRREGFDLVADATHPYADQATENILSACGSVGCEYMRVSRDSQREAADGVFVESVDDCVSYLKGTHGNVLLTTGSKDLSAFCADESLRSRVYARVLPMAKSLSLCEENGISPDRIIAMQGPFDEEMNLATLKLTGARYMVTKDTGAAGGYQEKISAARKAGVTAVIIARPSEQPGMSVEEAVSALEARFGLKKPLRRPRVTLAGIGMGGEGTQTLALKRAVSESDCLIGAGRMLESVDTAGKKVYKAYLPGDVAEIVAREENGDRFTVLLSGDTGFYSGAKGLVQALKDAEVEVLPGISSLQYLASRLKRDWQEIRPVSLHGRDGDLIRVVGEGPAAFVLVGGEAGVNAALRSLTDAGLGDLNVTVGERLGYPNERITSGAAAALADGKYDPLSALLVDNPRWADAPVTYGLPDEAFERDETPMTKSEVRSVSMSKLALSRGAVVYDVGSGSGSVSVEAAMVASRGHVYAVEMKSQAAALTRRNAEKFRLSNITVVEGKAPEALKDLPAPTHAFIGGSSGSMREIIACLLEKNPMVRVVANAVTLESVSELSAVAGGFDHADIAEISVSKPRKLGRYRLMTAQNPVYVFAMWNGKDETADE